MGRTYTQCTPDVADLLAVVMRDYHPELEEVGVTVSLLFAYGPRDEDGELTAPAIVVGGHPAAACVRIVNLKDRAKGIGDAEIVIDGDRWPDTPGPAKAALLDHELTHLKLGDGEDDLKRPKLKMRKHTVQIGWFPEVAERHGEMSFEVQQARRIVEAHGQTCFPFMAHPESHENRIRRAAGAFASSMRAKGVEVTLEVDGERTNLAGARTL